MKFDSRIISSFIFLEASALFIAMLCYAAPEPNFGPATRETDRAVSDAETRKIMNKMRRPQKVSIAVEESGTGASEVSGGQKFFVKEIRFNGMRTLSAQDLSLITKKYTDKEISAQDLKKLTKEIELEYMRRGIISSVFIPAQEMTDETLIVQVLEPDTQ